MKTTSSITLLSALAAAVLLTGCYTGGPRDWEHHGHHGSYDPDGAHGRDVSGTVQRVNPRDQSIVVDLQEPGDRDDRTGPDDDRSSRAMILYYDDETTVEHDGQDYRPENLEPGDRIVAQVGRSREGLYAQSIQVVYDASGGGDRYDRRDQSPGDDRRGDPDGADRDRDDRDRADQDRRDRVDRRDQEEIHPDARIMQDLRGTVRSTDTSGQTLDIERPGRTDVAVVHYDDRTVVEFEGRQYTPDNLEQGDVVEIQLRDGGRGMIAQRIVVVGQGQQVRE